MSGGRWYPTGTVLADGTVLAISGLDVGSVNDSIDIYHPSTNSWTHSGNGFLRMPLYPRMTLLPNGKVFASGANQNTKTYVPSTGAWKDVAPTIFGRYRDYGTSVLLPLTPARKFAPRVLILGGGPDGKDVTDTTELIDLSVRTPAWTAGPKMVAPRIQPYLFTSDGTRAARPAISSTTPTAIHYGASFDIVTHQVADIKSVELIRAGAVTHAFDMGVPSVAQWVHLTASTTAYSKKKH